MQEQEMSRENRRIDAASLARLPKQHRVGALKELSYSRRAIYTHASRR